MIKFVSSGAKFCQRWQNSFALEIIILLVFCLTGESRLHLLCKTEGNMAELQLLLKTGYSVNYADLTGSEDHPGFLHSSYFTL